MVIRCVIGILVSMIASIINGIIFVLRIIICIICRIMGIIVSIKHWHIRLDDMIRGIIVTIIMGIISNIGITIRLIGIGITKGIIVS